MSAVLLALRLHHGDEVGIHRRVAAKRQIAEDGRSGNEDGADDGKNAGRRERLAALRGGVRLRLFKNAPLQLGAGLLVLVLVD